MVGQPLRYTPRPDHSFLLYSVGENRKDDGPDGTTLPEKSWSHNMWTRKDAPWPTVATAQEPDAARKSED